MDLRFFLAPSNLPPECREREFLEMFKDVLVQLPAESADLHECIKYFTSTALDQYLHSCEEDVLDSDISNEFHRESHHIHSIPRPRISQVGKLNPTENVFQTNCHLAVLMYFGPLYTELESENETCATKMYKYLV